MSTVPRRPNKAACPYCGSDCKTVKTAQLAPTYREVTYACLNSECGCVFVASVEPIRILEPSSLPDTHTDVPVVSRPMAPHCPATAPKARQLALEWTGRAAPGAADKQP